MKPRLLNYDWKEGPGQVLEDLEPILKKRGIYLIPDPDTVNSDNLGYVLTDNPNITVAEYRRLHKSEYGEESDEWLDELCQEHEIKPTDCLTKLVKSIE